MPNLIALEWDDSEARVAVADVRRGSVVLEQAFAVALPKDKTAPDASGATGTISVSGAHDLGAIGRRISDALTARGIRRVKTVVGVGRANIELKNLSLPPAPPEELPEMVRFQAEREFNTLTDEWPLDFLPLPSESDGTLTVLAAAISPELVAEIQITCENANLTPQRLILRPCAAASLLSRAKPIAGENLRLLVDLLTEEADLTVLPAIPPSSCAPRAYRRKPLKPIRSAPSFPKSAAPSPPSKPASKAARSNKFSSAAKNRRKESRPPNRPRAESRHRSFQSAAALHASRRN